MVKISATHIGEQATFIKQIVTSLKEKHCAKKFPITLGLFSTCTAWCSGRLHAEMVPILLQRKHWHAVRWDGRMHSPILMLDLCQTSTAV